jgi:hypothetical protein
LKIYKIFFLLVFIFFSCDKTEINIPQSSSQFSLDFVKTYGGTKNDAAQSVVKTQDGGFIVLGYTQSSDNDISDKLSESYDYWVLKFDANSELEWNKTFGGSDDDRGRDIIQTTDGSYIITGFSRSSDGDITDNAGSYDFWTLKIDGNGAIIWEKSFGFSGTDQSYTIKETSDGGFLLAGTIDVTASGGLGNSKTSRKHAGGDYWLVKIDANGNKLWSRYYGGNFTDVIYDVEETANGDFILVGSSDSQDTDITNNRGSYDFWVVKINSVGTKIWQNNYGGTQIDEAFSITKTPENNFLIAGNSRSSDDQVSVNNGSSDIWILQINSDGELLWEKNYGGSSFENARQIIPSLNGGFYVAGSSRSSDIDLEKNNGNKDAWVFKINSSGDLEWQKSIGGSDLEEGNSITELNNGNLIIVGESWSSDADISENKGFSDALIIKLK